MRMRMWMQYVVHAIEGNARVNVLLLDHDNYRRYFSYPHLCSRVLTYAHVCSRMLTYAHVCSRMLTYAHVC